MKRMKKGTNKTSPSGKQPSQDSPLGNQNGEREDRAGILNAQQWQERFSGKNWISIPEASI